MSNSRSPRAVRSMTIGIRGMPSAYLGHEHCRAIEATSAEIRECPLGLLERIGRHRRPDGDLAGEREKLEPVLARQVRDRADLVLVVEEVIRERRDLGHV